MYLCYVDESGFTEKGYDEKQPVQVLAGLLVNVHSFHKLDNDFRKIYSIVQAEIPPKEIKGSEIYNGKKSWKNIAPKKRYEAIEFYLDWLTRQHKKNKVIRVILSVVDNKKFFQIKENGDKYKKYINTFPSPWVVSAFHIALAIQHINRNKKRNKGKTILIFDEQDMFEETLRELIYSPPEFIDNFVKFDQKSEKYRLNQIMDTPYFVKSHYSSLTQAADIVAFIFRRYIELKCNYKELKRQDELDRLEKWTNKIRNCFVPSEHVYPKKNNEFVRFLRDLIPCKECEKLWQVHNKKQITTSSGRRNRE